MQLLIATTNLGKITEISSLLIPSGVEIITPNDLYIYLKVAETGSTYQENALLKALAYSQASGLPVLADDTGLEVDALGGLPGIKSARFIPDLKASDRDRRKLLLEKVSLYPRPWVARFVCFATFIYPGKLPISTQGECQGEIIPEEKGEHGFGYDAIFLVHGTRKTMAELDLQEKNHISHRAKAINALIPYLTEFSKDH